MTSPSRLLRIVSTDFFTLRSFCFNIRQHGRQISYFKLHVDGCKFHYRRPHTATRLCTVAQKQRWPTCLQLGSTRSFVTTHDRPVGNNVTSTKCHKLLSLFLCTFPNIDWKMFFTYLVNSMQNQARSTNWDSVIDVLATHALKPIENIPELLIVLFTCTTMKKWCNNYQYFFFSYLNSMSHGERSLNAAWWSKKLSYDASARSSKKSFPLENKEPSQSHQNSRNPTTCFAEH